MLNNQIKQLVASKGRSIYWLAKQIKVSPSHMKKLCDGELKLVKLDELEQICTVLHCTVGDLFTNDNPVPAQENKETCKCYAENIFCKYDAEDPELPYAIGDATLATARCLANRFELQGEKRRAIMWRFIEEWECFDNECGIKLVDYDQMLYPQCQPSFEKTIPQDVFVKLQERAKKNLADTEVKATAKVKAHWEAIAAGEAPFGYTIGENYSVESLGYKRRASTSKDQNEDLPFVPEEAKEE